MKAMKKTNNISKTYSIHDYLNLDIYSWIVEFDVRDFGASISTLFELPLPIYLAQARDFFWTFISQFTKSCSIAFILRNNQDAVDLALIGTWNSQNIAIPLWIMHDTLIGFEIITSFDFSVLDSLSLKFESVLGQISREDMSKSLCSLDSDSSKRSTFHFRISDGIIHISEHPQDYESVFFERIASTAIPEIDHDPFVDENHD